MRADPGAPVARLTLAQWEREGPAAKRWEGEGALFRHRRFRVRPSALGVSQPRTNPPSPSHAFGAGPFLSRWERGRVGHIHLSRWER
jgi:hypothetical protein